MTVAEEARETFLKIRELRKTLPTRTKAQRDDLEKKIRDEHDAWWERVKPSIKRGRHPWDGYGSCWICDGERR